MARPVAPLGAPERDLVVAVWTELAAIEPARRCCRSAERAGLGDAAAGRARTPAVGRLAVRLEDAAPPDGRFDWPSAANHCRSSFLRGAALAHGSLSVTSAGLHLELVVPTDEIEWYAGLATELGHPAGSRQRRGRGVLTWKSSESIVNLLRRLGATASTLELESRLVHGAVRSHLNRVVNAENANLRRAVAAAASQLADIEVLDSRGDLDRLPSQVRRVAAARRRAPEATFTELAANLDLSRGQVQRAFALIANAALHAEDADDGRRPTRSS